jgi:hypothetical protein
VLYAAPSHFSWHRCEALLRHRVSVYAPSHVLPLAAPDHTMDPPAAGAVVPLPVIRSRLWVVCLTESFAVCMYAAPSHLLSDPPTAGVMVAVGLLPWLAHLRQFGLCHRERQRECETERGGRRRTGERDRETVREREGERDGGRVGQRQGARERWRDRERHRGEGEAEGQAERGNGGETEGDREREEDDQRARKREPHKKARAMG